MKFVTVLVGKEVGCDYTIDCNKTFEVFEVSSIQQALDKVNQLIDSYGRSLIESAQLFEVGLSLEIPINPITSSHSNDNLDSMFSG